jgi:hypothetical protein
MDLTPNLAAVLEVRGNHATQLVQMRQRPVTDKIPELHRPVWAVELEPSLAALPKRMDVRRRMIDMPKTVVACLAHAVFEHEPWRTAQSFGKDMLQV